MGKLEIKLHEVEREIEQQIVNQPEKKIEKNTNNNINIKKTTKVILWTIGISFILMLVISILLQNFIKILLIEFYNPDNLFPEIMGTKFDTAINWKDLLLFNNLQMMDVFLSDTIDDFEFITKIKIRIFVFLIIPFISILTATFIVKKVKKISVTSNDLSNSFAFGFVYAIILVFIAGISGRSVIDNEQFYQMKLSYSLLNVFAETFIIGSILYYFSISLFHRKEIKSFGSIFIINRAFGDLGKLYGISLFLVVVFICYQWASLENLEEELFFIVIILLFNGINGVSLLLTGSIIYQQEQGDYYQLSFFNEIIMIGRESDLENVMELFKRIFESSFSPVILIVIFAIPLFIFIHSGWNIAKKMKGKILIRCLQFSTVFTISITVIAYFSINSIYIYKLGSSFSNVGFYLLHVDMMELFVRSFVMTTIATFLGSTIFYFRKNLKKLIPKEVGIDE